MMNHKLATIPPYLGIFQGSSAWRILNDLGDMIWYEHILSRWSGVWIWVYRKLWWGEDGIILLCLVLIWGIWTLRHSLWNPLVIVTTLTIPNNRSSALMTEPHLKECHNSYWHHQINTRNFPKKVQRLVKNISRLNLSFIFVLTTFINLLWSTFKIVTMLLE